MLTMVTMTSLQRKRCVWRLSTSAMSTSGMLVVCAMLFASLPCPSLAFHMPSTTSTSSLSSSSLAHHQLRRHDTIYNDHSDVCRSCYHTSSLSISSAYSSATRMIPIMTTTAIATTQNQHHHHHHHPQQDIIATSKSWSCSTTALQATSTADDEESVVTTVSVDDPLPQPRVGDIVRYPGKWQDDIVLGEVLNLQYIEGRGKWIADVLPLKPIGENQYARQRGGRKTLVTDVESLQPVRAFYVRSANAFQVMTRMIDGGISYVSERGYDLTGFALPESTINLSELEKNLEAYEALKKRILMDTIKAGAVGSLLAFVLTTNVDNGLSYGLGALFATLYVVLLGKSADSVAFKTRSGSSSSVTSTLVDIGRLSLPATLALTLAAINIFAGGGAGGGVTDVAASGDVLEAAASAATATSIAAGNFLTAVIPRNQFASAMIGFVVSYRLPLIYRELKDPIGNLNADGQLSRILPGSLGAGSRLMSGGKDAVVPGLTDRRGYVAGSDSTQSTAGGQTAAGSNVANEIAVPVVVVSGPKGIGKSTLIRELAKRDREAGKAPMTMQPAWCTDRPPRATEKDSEEFIFMEPMKFEEQEKELEFIRTIEDAAGNKYGLRLQEIVEIWSRGKIPLIEADRILVETLMKFPGLVLVGVWVSLDSIAAIEERLRQGLLESGATPGDELESNVKAKTKRAISDIEFSLRSGVFDITVIFNDIDESVNKLRRAIGYASR